jgi:hypothetical protein
LKPSHHLVLGTVAAVALVPVLGTHSLPFGVAAVLIDADHYLDYLYRNGFKDFSLRRAVQWHDFLIAQVRRNPFLGLSLFHTVEVLALTGLLSFATGYLFLWAVFWGMLFHFGTDLVHEFRHRLYFKRAVSLVEYVVRWNLMKKRGQTPEAPYLASLDAFYQAITSPGSPAVASATLTRLRKRMSRFEMSGYQESERPETPGPGRLGNEQGADRQGQAGSD